MELFRQVVKPLEIVTRLANFDDYWEPMSTGQASSVRLDSFVYRFLT
jgi:hypothetical protein